MSFRHGTVLILAVLAGAALAGVAEGQGSGTATGVGTATTGTVSPSPETPGTTSPPSSELTHPQIQPTSGSELTVFTLTFTLREAPGHEGVMAIEYRVGISAPPGERELLRGSSAAGDRQRHGWSAGTDHAGATGWGLVQGHLSRDRISAARPLLPAACRGPATGPLARSSRRRSSTPVRPASRWGRAGPWFPCRDSGD